MGVTPSEEPVPPRPRSKAQGPVPHPPLGVRIRAGTVADSTAAARLHAEGITTGFLPLLGTRFLRRLYRRIVCEPGSFLIVAERDDGTVAGFIAGSEDTRALYRSFLRHDGIVAAAPVAGRLLRHWRRVAETLAHGSSGGGAPGRGAELLAVAVDPPGHGQGIGGSLVTAFLDEITRRGVTDAYVVVGEDNPAAVALYRGAGFHTADRFELHLGTASLLMQWVPGS